MTRPPTVEPLEPRQLLSAAPSAEDAPAPVKPTKAASKSAVVAPATTTAAKKNASATLAASAGHYVGTLVYKTKGLGNVSLDYEMSLYFQPGGQLTGWAVIGDFSFSSLTGFATNKELTLFFDSSVSGTFGGKFNALTKTVKGKFVGPIGTEVVKANVLAQRVGPAIPLPGRPSVNPFEVQGLDPSNSRTDGNPVPGLGSNPVPGMGNPVPGFGAGSTNSLNGNGLFVSYRYWDWG